MTPRLRAGLVLIAALAFGISPVFTRGFKGYDATQFPVLIENPAILPAGYAFSIWGLIYLWLFAHAGFGLWKRAADATWDGTRRPLMASLAIGAIWLAVAVQSPLWASLLITMMAAGALVALARAPAAPATPAVLPHASDGPQPAAAPEGPWNRCAQAHGPGLAEQITQRLH